MNISRIYKFGEKTATSLSLGYLSNSTRINCNKHMITHVNFLKKELPIRLAGRVIDLDCLPVGLAYQPSVQKVRKLYIESFNKIDTFGGVHSLEDVDAFTTMLCNIKNDHNDVAVDLSQGVISLRNSIGNDIYNYKFSKVIDKFLDTFYISRIGLRTLIELHIQSYNKDSAPLIKSTNIYSIYQSAVGEIHKILDRNYGYDMDMEFKWNGDKETEFTFIPHHLYYILIEVMKNSTQATIHREEIKPIECKCIETDTDIIIKISDNGISFSRDKLDSIFSYLYTTTYDNVNKGLSGYGHGLPLARLYAQYFGGDIKIVPYDGIGTEVIIYLSKTHSNSERLC